MNRLVMLTGLLIVCVAPLAMAQEGPGPMSWISLDTTKSGKSRQLIDATITEDGPMYDRLLRDGTLSSWGIAIPFGIYAATHKNTLHCAAPDRRQFQFEILLDAELAGEAVAFPRLALVDVRGLCRQDVEELGGDLIAKTPLTKQTV